MINFGQAIEALKEGKRLTRQGWNGKGMYVYYVEGFKLPTETLQDFFKDQEQIMYRPHIDLKAADGTIGAWNPNMIDILAEDWIALD
jgi:hypothetical protein